MTCQLSPLGFSDHDAARTSVKSASMLPVNTKPDTEEVNQGVSSATGEFYRFLESKNVDERLYT